jgi:hypothetical protein
VFYRQPPFISRIFRQGAVAVAQQKLSPALVYENRAQLCHFPTDKTDWENIPAKKRWLTYLLFLKVQSGIGGQCPPYTTFGWLLM